MSKNTRNRILLTAVAALLLVVMTVGGTLAWLQDNTEAVTNTFKTANIVVELEETMNTDTNDDGENDKWTMQLIPGTTKTKDPVVSVTTSVKAYVFVQFDCEYAEDSAAIKYDLLLNNGDVWTQGTTANGVPTNVWFTTVEAQEAPYTWNLLVGDKVSIPNTAGSVDEFTMTFDAWAVQYAKSIENDKVTPFTPSEAWGIVSGT